MPLTDRVLMGPGPCNPYPEAVAALARPMLGHLDPEFVAVLDETCDRLRTVFGTGNPMTLPISGTGSAGMEAAFVNLVSPGDPVVVGVNGVFGARMCDVAARCGAEVVAVEVPWGSRSTPSGCWPPTPPRPSSPWSMPRRRPGCGPTSPRWARARATPCWWSTASPAWAASRSAIDGWGVDVAYAGTQKCLGVPPGLAPLTLNERARARWSSAARRGTSTCA